MDSRTSEDIRQRMESVSSKFDDTYWRNISAAKKFPEEYWDSLAKAGLFGILVPSKWGGMGRSFLDHVVAVEQTSERHAGLGSYVYLSGSLVSKIIMKAGTEHQKNELLPKLARGELKISVALSEQSSGYDARSIETKAVEKGEKGEFQISGKKSVVANFDLADYIILFAKTDESISMFLVETKDPSLRPTELKEKLGFDFVRHYSIEIDGLRVDSSKMLGERGNSWRQVADVFLMDRVATASALVGTGRLALRKACDHARERESFGKIIGSNQGIQFPLADAYAQLLGAETLVMKAASTISKSGDGHVSPAEADSALLQSIFASTVATDRALQTFGGQGYFGFSDVERYWRDVRVHKVHPLSEELLLAVIAEKSLGLPKSY
jgi:acyl-CoA dehydrogenase